MTSVESNVKSSSGASSSEGPLACAWVSLTLEEQLSNFKRIFCKCQEIINLDQYDDELSESIAIVVKELRIDPHIDIGGLLHEKDTWAVFCGSTSLHWAVLIDDRTMVQYILTLKKVDINASMSSRKYTALLIAMTGGNYDIAEDLLKHKADACPINIVGESALYYMVLHKDSMFGILKTILANNVNMCDEAKNTTLHYAAKEGAIDVVTYLLDGKAEVNVCNQIGCTPLHYAVEKGFLHIVTCLLQENADVKALNDKGENLLHIATKSGAMNVVSFFVEQEVDIQALENKGWGPLLHSMKFSIDDILNGLKALGVNVHDKDQRDNNALHLAIEAHSIEHNMTGFVKLLRERDIDINAKNSKGYSPFFVAVAKGLTEMVQELLQSKEKIKLMDECNGETAIQIAYDYDYERIKRLLLECDDVSRYVDDLYRDRQVYVDAANAILVGAALIAGITFASWLQPPLGYTTPYLDLAPSSSDVSYVDLQHNVFLRAFWVCNAFSFYFAIATVVFGARSVLPRQRMFIKTFVVKLHRNLLVTSILLSFSVFFVIIAFGIAGCIVLTPTLKFQWYMIVPAILGGSVCLVSLGFLFKTMVEDNFKKKKRNTTFIFF